MGATGVDSSTVNLRGTSCDLEPEAPVEVSFVSLQSTDEGRELGRWNGPCADEACGGAADLVSRFSSRWRLPLVTAGQRP